MDVHLRWASETGHALDLMRQFADSCTQRGISIASVGPLEESTVFRKGIWVMFVSTTGQGAHPFSMRPLWKDMMKKGYKIDKNLNFAVYSLGDRGYGDNFAMAARKLRQRLKMLGAEELIEIGLGDDQDPQGYRQVYLSGWAEQLLLTIKTISSQGLGTKLTANLRDFSTQSQFHLKSIKELSSRKGRKVLWLQFQTSNSSINQGDVLQIFPYNRPEQVQYMLKHFNKDKHHKVQFLGKEMPLIQVLTQYANISSVLNYYFFSNRRREQLITSAKNQLHRDKLRQFTCDYEEFFNFIVKYKRNIVEFLRDFQVELDLGYFLASIGQVVGRKYSVARVRGDRLWILVKLVQNQITEGRLYKGLCSHDLLKEGIIRKGRILRGDIVPEQLRKFNLLVTLGTGIAPFIWVIDRLTQGKSTAMLLYTNSFSDELFHQKLCEYKGQRLTQIVSCTREEGGTKIIRLIENNLAKIADFLRTGEARVFYCGPKEIQDYLLRCVAGVLELSVEEVQKKKLIVYQNW